MHHKTFRWFVVRLVQALFYKNIFIKDIESQVFQAWHHNMQFLLYKSGYFQQF